jgi:hypothetical protein
MIVVEHQAHSDAALQRRVKRCENGGRGGGLEPEVVDGDVDGLGGAIEETGDSCSDRVCGLTSVS